METTEDGEPVHLLHKTILFTPMRGASFRDVFRDAFEVSLVERLPVKFYFNNEEVNVDADKAFHDYAGKVKKGLTVTYTDRHGHRREAD